MAVTDHPAIPGSTRSPLGQLSRHLFVLTVHNPSGDTEADARIASVLGVASLPYRCSDAPAVRLELVNDGGRYDSLRQVLGRVDYYRRDDGRRRERVVGPFPPGSLPHGRRGSPGDPSAALTSKGKSKIAFAYGTNCLIDTKAAIIVDVEASPARV